MTAAQPYEKSIVKEPFLRLECDLGEGPYYEEITNSLRIVDIKKKQLHTVPLDDFNNYTTTQLNEPISVTADIAGIDPKRKILVALKYGLAILDREKGDYEYICQYDNFKNERLRSNDGAVDPNGRFWVGNMMDFGKGPMQPEGRTCNISIFFPASDAPATHYGFKLEHTLS
jgi:sugar lactone lactonase YvrE